MDEYIKAIEIFSNEHLEHKFHLEEFEQVIKSLRPLLKKLEIATSSEFPYKIQKVQIQYLLHSTYEMNIGLVTCLKNNLFSVAESLSRVSLEHSVNLIYIASDTHNLRSKSLLRHYIDDAEKRAIRWMNYSIKEKIESSIIASKWKLLHIKEIAKMSSDLFHKSVEPWPNARSRFSAVGMELQYHTLFASASDSVHSLSEDIFNFTMVENSLPEIKNLMAKGVYSEKLSFAYYLAINASLYYIQAAMIISEKMKNSECFTEFQDSRDIIVKMLNEHESLCDKYRQQSQTS